MRLQALFTLLLSCCAVQGQHVRHRHPNLRLDALHQLIQKRNSTPFDSPAPQVASPESTVSSSVPAAASSTAQESSVSEAESASTTTTTTSSSSSSSSSSALTSGVGEQFETVVVISTLTPRSDATSTQVPATVSINKQVDTVPALVGNQPVQSSTVPASSTTPSTESLGSQGSTPVGSQSVENNAPQPTYIGAPVSSTTASDSKSTMPSGASYPVAANVQALASSLPEPSPSVIADSPKALSALTSNIPIASPTSTTAALAAAAAAASGLTQDLTDNSGLSTPSPQPSVLSAPIGKESILTHPSAPSTVPTSTIHVAAPVGPTPTIVTQNSSLPVPPKSLEISFTTSSTNPEVAVEPSSPSSGLHPSTTNQTSYRAGVSSLPSPPMSLPKTSQVAESKGTSTPTSATKEPIPASTTATTVPTSTSQTLELPPEVLTATSVQSSTLSAASQAAQATTSATGSLVLPAAIAPADGIVMPNALQTIVQIGFLVPLNYPFVVSNALATAQILSYTPKAIAFALGLAQNAILANSLRPYNKPDYVATVAYIVIPSADLARLEELWNNTSSSLYNQVDTSLQSLVVQIDTSIPLLLSSSRGSTASTTKGAAGSAASDASTARYGSLADTGPSSGTTSSTTRIVGIGIGSAAAAGLYAGAMFLVARRRRSRRVSIFAPMGQRGRRGISRPMNPENSLGI